MFAIFGVRGGADDADLAARKCRFEDIRGIEPALGVSGADDGVQFIDEENDIGTFFRFADDFLESCLEFTSKTGSGHDECKVEREETLA